MFSYINLLGTVQKFSCFQIAWIFLSSLEECGTIIAENKVSGLWENLYTIFISRTDSYSSKKKGEREGGRKESLPPSLSPFSPDPPPHCRAIPWVRQGNYTKSWLEVPLGTIRIYSKFSEIFPEKPHGAAAGEIEACHIPMSELCHCLGCPTWAAENGEAENP